MEVNIAFACSVVTTRQQMNEENDRIYGHKIYLQWQEKKFKAPARNQNHK